MQRNPAHAIGGRTAHICGLTTPKSRSDGVKCRSNDTQVPV
jgi:hypothetical protein